MECREGGHGRSIHPPNSPTVSIATRTPAKAAAGLETDRAHSLREAMFCCRKGGTVSIPGVYIGLEVPLEKAPEMYKTFRDKKDKCVKFVLKP